MTVNYTIRQGETWRRVLRWEQGTFVYKTITAIAKSAPISITATTHGLVDGWRVAISNVGGMEEINASQEPPPESEYHRVTVVDANTITINSVNALGFSTYTTGGVLRYRPPVDLAGFEARMQIRKSQKSPEILFSLASDGDTPRIFIDNTAKTITLLISDEDTQEMGFTGGVYDLEMISSGGEVTILCSGEIEVVGNVTRPVA